MLLSEYRYFEYKRRTLIVCYTQLQLSEILDENYQWSSSYGVENEYIELTEEEAKTKYLHDFID